MLCSAGSFLTVIVIHVRYIVYGLVLLALGYWVYRRYFDVVITTQNSEMLETALESSYDFIAKWRHDCVKKGNKEATVPRKEFDKRVMEELNISRSMLKKFTRYCEECKYIRMENNGKDVHMRRTPAAKR